MPIIDMFSEFFILTAEFAETAEVMMIIKLYNFSACSACSAVNFFLSQRIYKII